MTAPELLTGAGRILDGDIDLGARGPRVAAVLTRSVFEDWLDWVCEPWIDVRLRRPTTRSKLIVMDALHASPLGDRATRAWEGLSRACHLQAYELQPSVAEVRNLHSAVAELLSTPVARESGVSEPLNARTYIEERTYA